MAERGGTGTREHACSAPKVLSIPVCWVLPFIVGKEFRPSASYPSLVLVLQRCNACLAEVESPHLRNNPERSNGEPERPEASRKASWGLTWSHKGVL